MKRFVVLISILCILGICLGGCSTDTVTTPETSSLTTPEQAYESGGFDALMEFTVSIEGGDHSTWSDVQAVLKTADPDTIILVVAKAHGTQAGYWETDIITTVHPSSEARGYDLPFTVTTSDPNGWTYVGATLGTVYSSEPGTLYGFVGNLYSTHVKLGWTYPAWVTNGQYAVHTIRCNSQFLLRAPSFTAAWDEDNVEVRDVNNGPITDYVLID